MVSQLAKPQLVNETKPISTNAPLRAQESASSQRPKKGIVLGDTESRPPISTVDEIIAGCSAPGDSIHAGSVAH
ncbi:hypothetical protein N7513_006047 [Penicillium frequentans]|nr:hypothetical protein N7513_006047 [Penicillium glabrum]